MSSSGQAMERLTRNVTNKGVPYTRKVLVLGGTGHGKRLIQSEMYVNVKLAILGQRTKVLLKK